MQIMQSRRDFLASASLAAAASVLGARGSLADEAPPETTTIRLGRSRASASRRSTSPRSCCARRASPTSATCAAQAGVGTPQMMARGEVDFSMNFAAPLVIPIDAGEPITVLAGVHRRLLRAVRARARPQRSRDLKGKSVGVPGAGLEPARLPRQHGDLRRARSRQGHQLGRPARRPSRWSCSPRARSTPSSAFRPSRRSCAPARSAT